jgi:catechol 2,3-dioxygenase-like lactoylglutathione lyase family enzyme
VASGEQVSAYMGIPGWVSDHVTLVLKGADVHQEVQLLFFHAPPIKVDDGTGTLDRTGFNHVCFRVNDLAAMLEHLAANGITPRNEVLDYHDRKLVFLDGPGVVVELAEWSSG